MPSSGSAAPSPARSFAPEATLENLREAFGHSELSVPADGPPRGEPREDQPREGHPRPRRGRALHRAATPDVIAGAKEILTRIHLEDIPMCEGIQRGMQSLSWKPGRLSRQEEKLRRFHRYLSDALVTPE